MNIFKKLLFVSQKTCVVLIVGKARLCVKEAVSQVLKQSNALVFESDLAKDFSKVRFFLKNSKMPILISTHIGDIPPDRDFFSGERRDTVLMRKLAEILPEHGFLILNFDDEAVREIGNRSKAKIITYGFQNGADLKATDVNFDLEGVNFKINHEGNTVPFWLNNILGKEQIYCSLAAACLGVASGRNLVEMSQVLKDYKSLPGKMRLIEGIKKTLIIDDSENATVASMIEGLAILGKIGQEKRKIAVLGDILGAGKYAIEAHEAIGAKAAKSSDILFAIGLRAKFIGQGARRKGMKDIFEFDTAEQGKTELQKQIKQGDLILVDGSREMNMGEIIEEIKSRS